MGTWITSLQVEMEGSGVWKKCWQSLLMDCTRRVKLKKKGSKYYPSSSVLRSSLEGNRWQHWGRWAAVGKPAERQGVSSNSLPVWSQVSATQPHGIAKETPGNVSLGFQREVRAGISLQYMEDLILCSKWKEVACAFPSLPVLSGFRGGAGT